MQPVVAASIAIVIALVLTPVVMRIAPRIGAVARPGERHVHTKITPTAGGLAIFIAFWVPTLIANWPLHGPLVGILIGSILLVVVCLLDDIYALPAKPRLLAQLLIGVLTYMWGVRITGMTSPAAILGTYQYISLGWLSAPLTVLWIAFMMNAINWLDGLDGLAAGVAGIASLSLAFIGLSNGSTEVAISALALGGAVAGFLPYNFNPAKIFMGDTGAMFLGYILATLSVTGASKAPTLVALIASLLVLGVPIYDSLSTMAKRIRAGQSVFSADKRHLHHRLLARGLSVRQAVLFIYGLTALSCLGAILIWVYQ